MFRLTIQWTALTPPGPVPDMQSRIKRTMALTLQALFFHICFFWWVLIHQFLFGGFHFVSKKLEVLFLGLGPQKRVFLGQDTKLARSFVRELSSWCARGAGGRGRVLRPIRFKRSVNDGPAAGEASSFQRLKSWKFGVWFRRTEICWATFGNDLSFGFILSWSRNLDPSAGCILCHVVLKENHTVTAWSLRITILTQLHMWTIKRWNSSDSKLQTAKRSILIPRFSWPLQAIKRTARSLAMAHVFICDDVLPVKTAVFGHWYHNLRKELTHDWPTNPQEAWSPRMPLYTSVAAGSSKWTAVKVWKVGTATKWHAQVLQSVTHVWHLPICSTGRSSPDIFSRDVPMNSFCFKGKTVAIYQLGRSRRLLRTCTTAREEWRPRGWFERASRGEETQGFGQLTPVLGEGPGCQIDLWIHWMFQSRCWHHPASSAIPFPWP